MTNVGDKMNHRNSENEQTKITLSRKEKYKKKGYLKLSFYTLFFISCSLLILFNGERISNFSNSIYNETTQSSEVTDHAEISEINKATVDIEKEENTPSVKDDIENPSYQLDKIIIEESEKTIEQEGEIILLGEDDTILRGGNGKRDIYFSLSPSELGNESYIELTVSSSGLLLPELSTMTVLLNDHPLKSLRFARTFEYNRIVIPLKSTLLREGVNHLSVQSDTYINNDICVQVNDPANWVIIHKTSYIFIDSEPLYTTDDFLKNFPYPFVRSQGKQQVNTSIVIPDNSSGESIRIALQLGQFLSTETNDEEVVPIVFESEWQETSEKKHLIAIGPLEAWNGKVAELMTKKQLRLPNNDIFLHNVIEKSGDVNRQILFVIGNEKVLNEKISVLTVPEITRQLTGNSLRISHLPKVEQSEVIREAGLPITERSFLLDDTRLNSETFFLQVPAYWAFNEGADFNLSFRASPLLKVWKDHELINQLGLTIFINEEPFTVPLRKVLDFDNIDDQYFYQFPISNHLISANPFIPVRFEFNYPFTQEGCKQNYNSGNWITVEKESSLVIPHEINRSFSFTHWPGAFMNENGYEKIAFVVPENIQGNGINQLSLIVNHLSSYDQFDHFTIVQGNLNKFSKNELADYHFIVLSSEVDPNFLEEIELIIGDNEINLHDYGFLEETTKYVARLKPSPFNEDKAVVHFSALVNNEYEPYLSNDFFQFLGDIERTKESTIVVFNKGDEVFTYEKEHNGQNGIIQVIDNIDTKDITIYSIIFVTIFVIAGLTFLYLLRKKKR